MGRRGGYGNAGYFAQRMELQTWYDVARVVEFFDKDPEASSITKSQAKAVIDALVKAQCYKTKRHPSQFAVMLEHRMETEGDEALPIALDCFVLTTKEHYLKRFLYSRWDIMAQERRITLSKRDPRLVQISTAKDKQSAISVEGDLFTLAAWGKSVTEPGKYDLVLQLATPEKLRSLTNSPICVDLS
ncbi:hypothetical protein NTE19_003312 [Vibrio fluvialis]|nr:hypothetical protein [Vibrio fluvialis]